MTEGTLEDRLIDFLCNIAALDGEQANRDCLLKNLSDLPVGTINRSNAPYQDLWRIVKTVKIWGQIPDTEEYALEILMESVRVFVKGTELEETLNILKGEFRQSVQEVVNIHTAIMAMFHSEAVELVSGSVFRNRDERENFEKVKVALQKYGINDLAAHYKDDRDGWRPFGADKSIQGIMQDMVDILNKERKRSRSIHLHPLSSAFLSSDPIERRSARSVLQESGGILIVDPISMYHPTLRDIFLLQNKIFDQSNPVALSVISPLSRSILEANKLFLDQIYTHPNMEDAFEFFEERLDLRYEFGVDELCNLRRWLFSILPPEGRMRNGLTSMQRNAVRNQVGKSPQGIDRLVTGVKQ